MKAFLMHKERDFDLQRASPPNEADLSQDLELDTLFAAMALADTVVLEVVKKALLTGVYEDLETIRYRQDAVRDSLRNAPVVRQLYSLAVEALDRQRKVWVSFREYPSGLLNHSVEIMVIFIDVLKRLRGIADRNAEQFKSTAFSNLFVTLARELDDEYFAVVDRHLKRLKFGRGVNVSVELGKSLKGANYVLRRPNPAGNWLTRIFQERPPSYTLHLAPRDENGARALSELRDRGLALAADAIAKSAEHILNFFRMLQIELAFYIGCVNLHDQFLQLGASFSFPGVSAAAPARFSCKELYDVCLALSMNKKPVANDIAADDKNLIIVTGANQGGKTTFLRSFGIAHLMMQCGMFVPAANMRANIVDGVFTHFKREEDPTMKSGKLDEELNRMNDIVNVMTPHSLLLFNESFAATNEREGSEIARQIVSALLEEGMKIVFVSHQYEFAHGYFEKNLSSALFLRADRQEDGRRTFKLAEGEPLGTSFGEDLYRKVFLTDVVGQSQSVRGVAANS